MMLEPLKLFVGRKIRIFIIQSGDEAQRDFALFQMIQKRAAVNIGRKRPADGVQNPPRRGFGRVPQFFDSERVSLRVGMFAQIKLLHRRLRQRAAASFGENCIRRAQFNAGLIVRAARAVFADAHFAGRRAAYRAVFAVERFRSGEAGENIHARRFRLRAQPRRHAPQTDDIVSFVMHLRRRRQADFFLRGEKTKLVFDDFRLNRRVFLSPIGNELVQRARLQHRAGENVRADFRAFFYQADIDFALLLRGDLFQPQSRRQPRRPAADNQHIKLQNFAFAHKFTPITGLCCPRLQ